MAKLIVDQKIGKSFCAPYQCNALTIVVFDVIEEKCFPRSLVDQTKIVGCVGIKKHWDRSKSATLQQCGV
jgi:hypothetical protein